MNTASTTENLKKMLGSVDGAVLKSILPAQPDPIGSTRKPHFLLFALFAMAVSPVHALKISADLEVVRVPGVDYNWRSVSLQNAYADPVVVCTYALPSAGDNEATVRVQNVAGSGFDVKIQQPEDSSSVTPGDVYCIVAEEGLHTLPDGRQFEVHTVLSDGTNGQARGWGVGGPNGAENVSAAIVGGYPQNSQPAVLGQVMTHNDPEFSAFWSFDCDNRANVPFQSNINDGICVGKHVGQIGGASGNRANETLGYIVIAEGGSPDGSFGGIRYRVDLGGDSVAGVGNSPPYTYGLGASYDLAVATQEAEDGGQGGWAVLYGTDPLAGNAIDLAIDEETVAGDTTRTHTTEQVAYWAFSGTDYGDAPLSYGSASHNVISGLHLGSLSVASGDPDAEASHQFTPNADGDDNADIDDEDGWSVPSSIGPLDPGDSYSTSVTANNSSAQTAFLTGWIDWDRNGMFESDESVTVPVTGSGPVPLTFTVPADNPVYQNQSTYARFRISTDATAASNATGSAPDGEVEDYFLEDVTTPITLGYFRTEAGVNPGDIEFTWQTVTEVGNLGFNLYAREGEGTGGWSVVNPELISSQMGDSVETQTYSYSAAGVEGDTFALGDIDVYGKETIHGPFRLGAEEGMDRSRRQATNWKAIQSESKAKHRLRKAKRQQRIEHKLQRQLDREELLMRRQMQRSPIQ